MAKYDKPLGEGGIEWTGRTWNPLTGCVKVSPGCKFCYAEPLAKRLQRMGNARYVNGFGLTLHPDKVTEPASWRDSDWIFVNSMSDLLQAGVPDAFISDVFDTMGRAAPWHRYQVLTKRADRWESVGRLLAEAGRPFPANVLPGASVEDRRFGLPRIDELGRVGDDDTVRMLSVEPLLESLCDESGVAGLADRLRRNRIGWVITGGESGHKARPAELDWFREVRDACKLAGVPFFHKQHGGVGTTHEAKRGGKLALLDGVLHHEMPDVWAAPAPGRTRGAQQSLLVAR